MPLRFTLRQLEYFVAVGDLGSITLASEKVNVSSPSISAAISQLEKEFGLSLFARKHAYGLTLTSAGTQMIKQAKRLLSEADALNNMAGDISGVVRGPLAVGCLLTFAQLIVPDLRKKFEEKYPEARISQFEMNQTQIFDHLRRAAIDVALSYDLDIPLDLEFVPLIELPPYVLVHEQHPIAQMDAVSVHDLKDHTMVLLDLPHSNAYFTSIFSQVGMKPIIAERTKDMAVMRSLVANGYGYSIANIRPLNDLSPDGKQLKFIPLTGDVRPLKLGLITTNGASNTFIIQAFTEHCRALITGKSVSGLNIELSGAKSAL